MPRALVLCEFPTLNGGERSLLAVLPTLGDAGWTVDVCCPPAGPLAEAVAALGLEVIPAPVEADRRRRDERFRDFLAERIKANRYDLIHANSLTLSIATGFVSSDLRVPTIGHIRDIARLSSAKVAALSRHTRVLAVSAAARDYHIAQGLAAERAHVLYNGVDTGVFGPATTTYDRSRFRREFGIPPEAPLVGIVGQIILRKGQDVALAAAVEVLRRRAEAHVVVVGARHSEKPETIEYERKLHAITAAAGVADRVHFAGTRDDMPALFREFAVLLHTARQEPLGRVLLEAAATGLAVVATEVGGTREIFPAGEANGAMLIAADDVAAASCALDKLLADGDFRRRLGAAGRTRMEAAFTARQSAACLLRHYGEVAAMPAPDPGQIVL